MKKVDTKQYSDQDVLKKIDEIAKKHGLNPKDAAAQYAQFKAKSGLTPNQIMKNLVPLMESQTGDKLIAKAKTNKSTATPVEQNGGMKVIQGWMYQKVPGGWKRIAPAPVNKGK